MAPENGPKDTLRTRTSKLKRSRLAVAEKGGAAFTREGGKG